MSDRKLARAVWVDINRDFSRPADIDQFVAWCVRHGVTITFPCVNHCTGGMTYASDVAPRLAKFDAWDPTPDLLARCRAAGLETHPWVCLGQWGPGRPDAANFSAAGPRPLQETHRDWFMVSQLGQCILDEPTYSRGVQQGGFLNVGLPPVQRFLDALCCEIMDRYDVDGIHLDYVRNNFARESWTLTVPANNAGWKLARPGDILQLAPRTGAFVGEAPNGLRAIEVASVEELPAEDGRPAQRRIGLLQAGRYGFNPSLLRKFEKQTGVPFFAGGDDMPQRVKQLYADEAGREAWWAFKSEQVARLVAKLHRSCRRRKRKLSAAVFCGYPWCGQEVAQRWPAWCNAGLLDLICPMDYQLDRQAYGRTLSDQDAALTQPTVPIYSGLLTGASFPLAEADLVDYERIAADHGRAGVCLYCYGGWRKVLA